MEDFRQYVIKRIKNGIGDMGQHMAISVSHPIFNAAEDVSDDKKELEFVEKINRFYSRSANSYANHIGRKYEKKAEKIYTANGGKRLSFLMTSTVTLNRQDILSVFCDLSYYDGRKVNNARFSQIWSYEKSAIMPSSICFDKGKQSKRYIIEVIKEIALSHAGKRGFNYYSDYLRLIERRFDFDNFYFVPRGTAFYYNSGVLSGDRIPYVFVIPNERIDGILKISF